MRETHFMGYSKSSVSASNAFRKNGIRTNRIRTNRGRIYVVKGTETLTNKPKFALIEFALFGDQTNRGIAVFHYIFMIHSLKNSWNHNAPFTNF